MTGDHDTVPKHLVHSLDTRQTTAPKLASSSSSSVQRLTKKKSQNTVLPLKKHCTSDFGSQRLQWSDKLIKTAAVQTRCTKYYAQMDVNPQEVKDSGIVNNTTI